MWCVVEESDRGGSRSPRARKETNRGAGRWIGLLLGWVEMRGTRPSWAGIREREEKGIRIAACLHFPEKKNREEGKRKERDDKIRGK